MSHDVHEWMLDVVKTADELGYLVRSVAPDKIGLSRPEGRSFVDVDLSGLFVNGAALRRILQPVSKESA